MALAAPKRSGLAVALLSLLYESPMHAYRMQQLIKERHKDEVVNVAQRNSVYQTIDRLLRNGLITVRETSREENRPERTVYQLTEPGRQTLLTWMHDMVATPAREFPEFPVALAHLPALTVTQAQSALRRRETALAEQVAQAERDLAEGGSFLPRVFLLETEYQLAVLQAELSWVRTLCADLDSGQVTWDFTPSPAPGLASPSTGAHSANATG